MAEFSRSRVRHSTAEPLCHHILLTVVIISQDRIDALRLTGFHISLPYVAGCYESVISVYSAYCGGMWLAALKMFTEMAKILGHQADSNRFNGILEKAKVSFVDKLWNGEFYYVSNIV